MTCAHLRQALPQSRWLSMVFTVSVIVNIVAIALKKYTNSMRVLAVIPLALHFFTAFVLVRAGVFHQMAQVATPWLNGRLIPDSPMAKNASARAHLGSDEKISGNGAGPVVVIPQ